MLLNESVYSQDKFSSSSCRTAGTDLPDPLSPPVSIVYRSRLHPASGQSCFIRVQAGRPVFDRPCEGVLKNSV